MEKQYYKLSKFAVNGGLGLFAILIALNIICLALIINNQFVMKYAIQQRNLQNLELQEKLNAIAASVPCMQPIEGDN